MRPSGELNEAITRYGDRGYWSVKTPKEMGFKVPKLSVPKMPSGRFALTPDVVRRLRKDFLTLMKNTKRAKTYPQLREFSRALGRWRVMLSRIEKQVDSRLYVIMGRAERQNPSESAKASAQQAKVYRKHVIKLMGDLLFELQELPIGSQRDFKGEPTGMSRDDVLDRWEKEGPKWEARARRKARKLWDSFDEFLEWSRSTDESWGAGGDITVSKPRKEQFQLEGFVVKTVGYSDKYAENIKRFGVALRQYKQRAARFVPALLKHKLPFIVSFESDPVSFGPTAYYDNNRIQVGPGGAYEKNVTKLVHLLAHEMGHHLYAMLSKEKVGLWTAFVKGGTAPIDLNRDVLSRQRSGEDDVEFLKRLKKEDPVLMMRLGTMDPTTWGVPSRGMMERIRFQAAKKGVIDVSTRLPSAYAAMDSSEAFSEVVGNLVGYGPRTVPAETLAMFKMLYPGSKTENRGLAGQLEDALTEPEPIRRSA